MVWTGPRVSRAAVGLVALLACTAFSIASGQEPAGPVQNALAGSRLFGTKGCVRCHSIRGLGGDIGPDLGASSSRRSFYDLATAMWNHLPSMVGRMRELDMRPPHLDPWEAENLVAFLFTLDYFDPPGDARRGERVFQEKRCVVCHQVRGVGGVVGPDLDFSGLGSPIHVAASMWNHGAAMARRMETAGVRRSTFSGSELNDVIAYIRSGSERAPEGPLYVLPGRADVGQRLFREKRCVECHSIDGVGGRRAPDLGRRSRDRSLLGFAAAMWNKAPTMMLVMREAGITAPRLNASEMADLVAYLYATRYFREAGDRVVGRRLITAKGCLSCHALDRRGGDAAPDLARTRGLDSPAAVLAAMWNHAAVQSRPAGEPPLPWSMLTSMEMAHLGAYLQSVSYR